MNTLSFKTKSCRTLKPELSGRSHTTRRIRVQIAAGEGYERRPVRLWGVAARVLPEGYVSVDERGFNRRKYRRAHVLFAEKFVDGAGAGCGQVLGCEGDLRGDGD